MILRGASILLTMLIAASCGGSGRAAPAANATSITPTSPSATPLINVNDMMGAFPPATFFVIGGQDPTIKAIALLNHAIKYRIAFLGKDPQVAAISQPAGLGGSGRVYVLDQVTEGARIRWFDTDSGTERASQVIGGATVNGTGLGHGALAVDGSTGIVYALLRKADGIAVDGFDWFTLKPARTPFGQLRCGERLAAASNRIAVACMSEGALVIDDSGKSTKLLAKHSFVAMAMLGDGTLVAGGADGSLVRLARQGTELEVVNALKDYGKGLIPDGIAVNAGCCLYYGVLDTQAKDVQVRSVAGGLMLIAFPASTPPIGGFFVQAPFAYYVIDGKARHIDINQGFQEVMADLGAGVGAGAVPGAVADR
jgi:hypothetical protein